MHRFTSIYMGGFVIEDGDGTHEVSRRCRAEWGCLKKLSRELFDRPSALKVQLLRAEEAMEALISYTKYQVYHIYLA